MCVSFLFVFLYVKIELHQRKNLPIPKSWGTDANGKVKCLLLSVYYWRFIMYICLVNGMYSNVFVLCCATLVSAFVLSRIDYCNSLLFGSTHDMTSHLQWIQNYAARVILRLPTSSNIATHLRSLHWLTVKVRSTCKIACLCYHCHSSTAPSYVTYMLQKKPSHTRSSSDTIRLLNRPAHSKATLGDHSFSFASSSVWNSIPNEVRCAPPLS